MPPVTPNAINDTRQLPTGRARFASPARPTPDSQNSQPSGSWEASAVGSWELLGLLDLLHLEPQHFAMGDGGLLLARLTRQRTREQLARPLPRDHDELEPIVLWRRLHSVPFHFNLACCGRARSSSFK